MWELSKPWWEFVLRAAVIFIFLLVLLRISGKKQIGEMSPLDLVLLLILADAVQNSMNAGDNTITAGLILASTLVGLSTLTDRLTYRSKTLEKAIEGEPKVLVHNGKIHRKHMKEETITDAELSEALRKCGVIDISEVRYAILETDGKISVIKKDTLKED
jgi:uncharacterized membrane protein YcaP (DUF421 family)